jgi:hypothetical protein
VGGGERHVARLRLGGDECRRVHPAIALMPGDAGIG